MPSSTPPYKVAKDRVIYHCDACGAELHSPLDEAGTRQKCPECQQAHVVPGAAEKSQRAEETARQRQAQWTQAQRLDYERKMASQQKAAEQKLMASERQWKDKYGLIEESSGPLEAIGGFCTTIAWVIILLGFVGGVVAVMARQPQSLIMGLAIIVGTILWSLPVLALGSALKMFAGIGKVMAQIAQQLETKPPLDNDPNRAR